MQYKVKIISSKQELHTCSRFEVSHGLWGTDTFPQTYGYLGFVPGEGFYLSMTCMEKDPYTACHVQQGSVCKDSAMEFFLQCFESKENPDIYLNIEFNSAGIMHAKYGSSRSGRTPLPLEGEDALVWASHKEDDSWSEEVFLPLSLLEKLYPGITFEQGSRFRCNFYKISETPAIEHYAAYAPLPVPKPDFHLPEFFAEAILV